MEQQCVLGNIKDINSALEKFIAREIKLMELDISKKHIPLFYILPQNGGLMVFNELTCKWGISKSSLSDIVNKYVGKGFIEKHECCEDKRLIYLQLTSEGLEIRSQLGKVEEAFKKTIYKDIDSDDQALFESVLNKVKKNINL